MRRLKHPMHPMKQAEGSPTTAVGAVSYLGFSADRVLVFLLCFRGHRHALSVSHTKRGGPADPSCVFRSHELLRILRGRPNDVC